MMADTSKPSDANMILVMGVTGSGKSYLINKLAGRQVVGESGGLDSYTAVCQAVPIEVGRTKVLLIDTPGFDDSERSDTEILTEISKLLAAQYKLGVSLKGIIYLHRITDIRYQGSSVRTLQIFKEICGEQSLKNVILATTRWGEVEESVGADRENRLREHFWSYMIDHGSTMTRFYGDRDSAQAMVSRLLGSGNIILDIQRQMVDEGKRLDETSAGALVNGKLAELISKSQRDLAEIEELRRKLRESDIVARDRLEEDRKREMALARQAQRDQVSLRTNVGEEVQQEMDVEMGRRKKKSSKLGIVLPLLPAALSILGMFIGVPTSVTGLFSSWVLGDGGDGGILASIFDGF